MIDILLASASRLEYLQICMKSFDRYLKYSGKFRWIFHEDVVIKEKSKAVLEWIRKDDRFNQILTTKPAHRLAHAVQRLLSAAKTKYILYLEDDWEVINEIDIDYIVGIMEKCPDINQIYFNKKRVETPIIDKGGGKVIVPEGKGPNEWAMGIGVWRLDFIKPRWKTEVNILGIYMKEIVGDYLYGKDDGKPNIKHIGKVSTNKIDVEM